MRRTKEYIEGQVPTCTSLEPVLRYSAETLKVAIVQHVDGLEQKHVAARVDEERDGDREEPADRQARDPL